MRCIRYVGETTAKTLANAVDYLPLFKEFSLEELQALKMWAPKLQAASTSSFTTKTTSNCWISSKTGAESQKRQKKNIIGGNLNGQSFLFTGSLTRLKR
jgi:DNA ligase (NAD+)